MIKIDQRSKKHLIDRYTYITKAYYQRSISRKGFRTTTLNSKFFESFKELPIPLRQKRKRFYGVLYVLGILHRGTCLLLCTEMETWMTKTSIVVERHWVLGLGVFHFHEYRIAKFSDYTEWLVFIFLQHTVSS